MTILLRGRVIFYDPARRFGFLVDAANKKYFFHNRDLVDEAAPGVGTPVQFQPAEHPRGRSARNVRALAPPTGLRPSLRRRLDVALSRLGR